MAANVKAISNAFVMIAVLCLSPIESLRKTFTLHHGIRNPDLGRDRHVELPET